MRIPSGTTDQFIYFVALDDSGQRVTGLSSFTVYRSRDGGSATAVTTPTINETDSTNMPGVYELLLDEDMTIGSGNDSEEYCVHIAADGMQPVTRTFELYRPKITLGSTLSVESIAAEVWSATRDAALKSLTISNDSGFGVSITGSTVGLGINSDSGAAVQLVSDNSAGVMIDAGGNGLQISATGAGLVVGGTPDIDADTISAMNAVLERLDALIEEDSDGLQFTAHALANAPGGGGGDPELIAAAVWDYASDTAFGDDTMGKLLFTLSTDVIDLPLNIWNYLDTGIGVGGSIGLSLKDFLRASFPLIGAPSSAGSASVTFPDNAPWAGLPASALNDHVLRVISGPGAGQTRRITGWNELARIASVATWNTQPTSESVIAVIPAASVNLTGWLSSTPSSLTSGRVDSQVRGMDTDVITNSAVSAAAVTKIQSGLAPAATALSNAVWTNERAARIDVLPDAAIVHTAGKLWVLDDEGEPIAAGGEGGFTSEDRETLGSIDEKLNENFVAFVAANTEEKSIDDLTTPKHLAVTLGGP